MWENTTPGTEIPRIFRAGIGPLQLGVVLVFFLIYEVSLKAKNRFLVQEVVCSVDRAQTTQTYTHESENRQKTPFKGVRNFSFNPSKKIHPS